MSEILNNFKKFIIREQQENNLQAAESAGRAIGQATAAGIQNAAGQATAAAPVKYKCSPDTFPLFLPVSFETVGLEDDIADAPMGLNDLSVPPVPPITSGIINELCTAIEQANPPAPKPGPSPDPNPNPDEEPDPGSGKCKSCRLEKGCRGEEVKKLQDALMKNHVFLRFFPDPEYDKGVFGKRTETAVINFQKKKKLTVDGIAGTETFKALGVSCKGGKKTKKTDKPGKSGEPVCPQEGLGTPKCPYKYAELVNLQKQNNPGSVNGKMIYFYANTPSGTRSKAGVLFSSDGEPSGISGQGFPRMNSQEAKEYLKTDVIPRSVYERATSELDVQRKEQGLKEAKNLNYENYYDNKKQQEAKILFERLIKKI
jgi:hypothetical protein